MVETAAVVFGKGVPTGIPLHSVNGSTFARGSNFGEKPTKLDWMADSVTPRNSL